MKVLICILVIVSGVLAEQKETLIEHPQPTEELTKEALNDFLAIEVGRASNTTTLVKDVVATLYKTKDKSGTLVDKQTSVDNLIAFNEMSLADCNSDSSLARLDALYRFKEGGGPILYYLHAINMLAREYCLAHAEQVFKEGIATKGDILQMFYSWRFSRLAFDWIRDFEKGLDL